MLPKDPYILFSLINTKLRDAYNSLDELCCDLNFSKEQIIQILKSIGYEYDAQLNTFTN